MLVKLSGVECLGGDLGGPAQHEGVQTLAVGPETGRRPPGFTQGAGSAGWPSRPARRRTAERGKTMQPDGVGHSNVVERAEDGAEEGAPVGRQLGR